jgi:tetratricopeptide (TPR) repeat protein
MQANVQVLSKKAIDAALKNNWNEAINLNLEILKKQPRDKKAKIRLGRAYMQLKSFAKAKKIFQEVLETDPINTIALKNLQMASQKKVANHNGENGNHTNALIKEPGTTAEVVIKSPNDATLDMEVGQAVNTRISKTKLTFLTPEDSLEIGSINDDTAKIVYKASRDKLTIRANVASFDNDKVVFLLKCKKPIFKAQKQQEKPYLKKGLIDEPELELPEHADADLDE